MGTDRAGPAPADERRPGDSDDTGDADDTLVLLFLCCHPSLSVASQIALTLRAVGGLSAAEIAACPARVRADGDSSDHPGEAVDQR